MKENRFISLCRSDFRHDRRGMALISVLVVLVLLTLLVVSFMGQAATSRVGTVNYKSTIQSRLLSDMAINLVQAQIDEATSKTEGTGFAWASQPGAIRLFDNAGALNTVYRLYSAQARLTTSVTALAGDLPASSTVWPPVAGAENNALWVDLNAPSSDAVGNYHFPILDPRSPASDRTNPIPSAPLVIPGFAISSTGVDSLKTSTDVAPMPVQWLYVLKNGSIIAPDISSSSSLLTFKNASVSPSVANPIVGRIAYWTDDDSNKVNINTAAGDDVVRTGNTYAADSIFWAQPMFASQDEGKMGEYQPGLGEYQRYPGHPGTVGLNSLLSYLCGRTTPFSYLDFYGALTSPPTAPYSMVPRYGGGGSQSATVPINNTGTNNTTNTGTAATYSSATRLYTSVAEMLFTAGAMSGGSRPASQLTNDSPNPSAGVERANFFLTAHSKAPELNLFGEPRVSIWPVSSTLSKQTAEDRLLAFDASVRTSAGLEPYYFQRTDPTSTVTDGTIAGNVKILNYLDTLTSSAIPGFGGNFTTHKYPNTATPPAMRQILTEIFDYIRTTDMADPNLPGNGYGINYGPNSPMGNYQVVPSANNTGSGSDPTVLGKGLNGWKAQGIGSFPVLVEASFQFVDMGLGRQMSTATPSTVLAPENPVPPNQYTFTYVGHDYMPIVPSPASFPPQYPTQANPTLQGDAIVDDTVALGGTSPGTSGGRPADNSTALQVFLLLTFLEPSLTNAATTPAFCVSVTGLSNLQLNPFASTGPIQLAFPGNQGYSPTTFPFPATTSSMALGTGQGWNGSQEIGYIPYLYMTGYGGGKLLGPADSIWNTAFQHYPFYSQLVAVSGQPTLSNNTFAFSGGTIQVTVNDGHTSNGAIPGRTITQYSINFPQVTLPIPKIPMGSLTYGYNDAFPASYNPTTLVPSPTAQYGGRVIGTGAAFAVANPRNSFYPDRDDRWGYPDGITQGHDCYHVRVDPNDVVESMVLSPGWSDARDLCLSSVPAAAFTTHPLWGSQMAHNMMVGNQDPVIGNLNPANWGTLVQNAQYSGFGTTNFTNRNTNFRYPTVPPELQGALTTTGAPGDWDNGMGTQNDGPWVNKADEGSLPPLSSTWVGYIPYFTQGNGLSMNQVSTFTPNRMMPSPVMFGSLPTGVNSVKPKPWQTLLFRPGSGTGGTSRPSHPGERDQPSAGDPADYLLLDFFWMPQAEPYPISEPFSTAGKINLNYEIQPFTYITRATALRALFAGEKIAVMPDAATVAQNYKLNNSNNSLVFALTNAMITTATSSTDALGDSRLPIDPDATLGLSFAGGPSSAGLAYGASGFSSTADPHATSDAQTGSAAWYAAGNASSSSTGTRFFKAPSEICEMFLVPQGYTWKDFSGTNFNKHSWYMVPNGDFALVGDNTRERPYADLYSRVTTKSNTYTIYYTVQPLKNALPQTDAAQATWNENSGFVAGEYRGSTTLERYLDPNEAMPDFQTTGNAGVVSLESYYKWRVVETHQFAP